MRRTDVVIVGGGLAGSLAAAMLGRAGIDAILIDLHAVYPADFRCEKLDGPQMQTLRLTGLAEAILHASTPDRECWVARFGWVVDKRPGDQQGILYDTLVNAVRSQIFDRTEFIKGKVTDISTSSDRQTVELSDGSKISTRLVVLATGLNIGVLNKLGIERRVKSAQHSISIGFDAEPVGRPAFAFPALTYYAERPIDRMPYITLFPIGTTMRANLFGYRDLKDPWLKQFRDAPQETLYAMWPRLRPLMGDFKVTDFIKVRPIDLVITEGYLQDGVVLVGDAFATSCPAAGTGARKVLVDVERLCNVHIPRWLSTSGMGQEKIAAFYDDPVKRACDAYSAAKAYELRSFSIDPTLPWAARRWAKFVLHWGRGLLRRVVGPQMPFPDDMNADGSPETPSRSVHGRFA
jgi:2-polyprenyl-6-methoxyphenol hydroxylase-like FAD-dependent oxidoreductase